MKTFLIFTFLLSVFVFFVSTWILPVANPWLVLPGLALGFYLLAGSFRRLERLP